MTLFILIMSFYFFQGKVSFIRCLCNYLFICLDGPAMVKEGIGWDHFLPVAHQVDSCRI